jgi:hypothetical protein
LTRGALFWSKERRAWQASIGRNASEANGLDVFLTGDQTLSQEQNLSGRRFAVVALSAIQLPTIRENLPKIIAAIGDAAPGSLQTDKCGTFSRKKPPGL